jgi:hypothetical protein
MRGHVPRSLEAEIEPTAEGVTIGVRSAHLDRVDAYIDQRPVGSQDVDHDRCVFRVPLTVIGPSPRLRLEGFERGCLAAVKVITVPGSPGATPSPPAAEGQTSPG